MSEKENIESQINLKTQLLNDLRREEAITSSVVTKFEVKNRIQSTKAELQALQQELAQLDNFSKPTKENLKQFKKQLKTWVDKGDLSEVFEEIQDTETIKYDASQFYSLRNRVIDGEDSRAFKQQIKTFIGTIQKK